VIAVEVRDVVLPDSMKRAMGRPSRVGAGATCENHKRRSRVSGRGKTRAGGLDDFCATDRPATALLTDD
jgi:hypothetical protein